MQLNEVLNLTLAQVKYLTRFSQTRRMKRDPSKLDPDPLRETVGLLPEVDGGLYVGSSDPYGQDYDHASVIDMNKPPEGQPSLWCKWVPTEDGTELEWNTEENFYKYIEWLQYLIEKFFTLWRIKVNGEVYWDGDDQEDAGKIMVEDSVVRTTGYICGKKEEDKVRVAIEFLEKRGFLVSSKALVLKEANSSGGLVNEPYD
jgi:hypothetical protein